MFDGLSTTKFAKSAAQDCKSTMKVLVGRRSIVFAAFVVRSFSCRRAQAGV